MFDKDLLAIISEKIQNSKNIALIVHKNPDGDAIGSALGLKFFLKEFKPLLNVGIISPTEIPEYMSWIDDYNSILIHENSPSDTTDMIMHADVIFLLDFNSIKRVDGVGDVVQVSNALKVMIDHHPNPQQCADFLFSYPSKSSTAEIVWHFIKDIDRKKITKKAAEYIFMGILSDTGCFCYDSADKDTFVSAAEILDIGIDKNNIISKLYNNFSENRTRLFGYLIYKKMKVFFDKGVAYITLTKEEKHRFAYKTGDHENFVNFPLTIRGINLSAFFMENDDVVRISLRSKGDLDVNKIARKYFFGGGHKNAAGGKFKGSISELTHFFENVVLKQIHSK